MYTICDKHNKKQRITFVIRCFLNIITTKGLITHIPISFPIRNSLCILRPF